MLPSRHLMRPAADDDFAKLYLNEITKSINAQTNNKSPGNDGLTAVL